MPLPTPVGHFSSLGANDLPCINPHACYAISTREEFKHMSKELAKIPNSLRLYRRKNGLSQKDIARLLGHKSSTAVSSYEQGTKSPHLLNLLKLEIINRVPVAYLYWDCYRTLRQEIRRKEELLRNHKAAELKC